MRRHNSASIHWVLRNCDNSLNINFVYLGGMERVACIRMHFRI
jgi:hypothetical protein